MERTKEQIMSEMEQGKFVKETYLSQYDIWEKKTPFEQFVDYRMRKLYGNIDLDVSMASMLTFSKIYHIDEVAIKNKVNESGKYGIVYKDNVYSGDTMTSAWTLFRCYLYYLALEKKYNGPFGVSTRAKALAVNESTPGAKYKEGFKDYFFRMCANNKEFFDEVAKTIKGSEAEKFLHNYMLAGNYMMIPGKKYQYKSGAKVCGCSFNTARSNGGKWDTVDRFLWVMYQYFFYYEKGRIEEAEQSLLQMFSVKMVDIQGADIARELVKDTVEWLSDFGMNTWGEFVSKNVLGAFVEIKGNGIYGKPISLKTGKAISNNIGEAYEPFPNSLEECEKLFSEVNRRIEERTREIYL